VLLPTQLGDIENSQCPGLVQDSTALCQDIEAVVTLILTDEENYDEIVTDYETALTQAIAEGRLQEELFLVNPDTPVRVLESSTPQPTPSPGPSGGTTLSAGATAGIVVAALVLLLVGPAGYYAATRGPRESKPNYEPAIDTGEQGPGPSSNANKVGAASSGILGASEGNYGRSSRQEYQAADTRADEDDGFPSAPGGDDRHSSDAGSSGWSDSAGLSSFYTGSQDDSLEIGGIGTTMAGLGAASRLAKTVEEKDT
jgi:hypothetical protein